MSITHLFCFSTNQARSGNPAAVVQGFTGADTAKQSLATEHNLPVTVFIENETTDVPLLRFFYPAREMPLCLHGTLAAAWILMQTRHTNAVTMETLMGTQLYVQKDETGLLFIHLEPGQKLAIEFSPSEIETMLQCAFATSIDPSLPLCVASIGSPKLIIPVKSKALLNKLMPHFEYIKSWSLNTGVNGLYVYTQDASPGIDFAARAFNPKGGLNEDPATGVAAGAVVSALPPTPKLFIFEQGTNMGSLSHLYVKRTSEHMVVGGRVAVVKKITKDEHWQ